MNCAVSKSRTRRPGVLHQPKPRPAQQPYASFLRGHFDSTDSNLPGLPAESGHDLVYAWLKSLDSGRWKYSRSDSFLCEKPVTIKVARSEPDMSARRDADGYNIPATPTSSTSRSRRAESRPAPPSDLSSSGRKTTLVESREYRKANLIQNGIHMRSAREKPPEHIANLIDHVRRDRQSPQPSRDQIWQDKALEAIGYNATEAKVENYFKKNIFPDFDAPDTLLQSERLPMLKHVTPAQKSNQYRISTPAPDLLYGYRDEKVFPHEHFQLRTIESELRANNESLILPFFAIEFKGDDGKLWVATNQCIGASTSCVNLAERLNRQLLTCRSDKVTPIDSAAFSIAMNNSEARLHISWKHNELEYYVQELDRFLLQRPEDYLQFRKYVRNIIDWGKDKRLDEIRCSLEALLEESTKQASQAAKRGLPSPDDSSAGRPRKGKRSSTGNGTDDAMSEVD